MSRFILQTINEDGQIIKESNLDINNGSILIQKIPLYFTSEEVKFIHDQMEYSLNNNIGLITVLEDIELQVLDIKD